MICECGKVLIRFIPSGGAFVHAHYVNLEGKLICESCAVEKGLKDRPTPSRVNTTYSYTLSDW